jgi:hypothetical protein
MFCDPLGISDHNTNAFLNMVCAVVIFRCVSFYASLNLRVLPTMLWIWNVRNSTGWHVDFSPVHSVKVRIRSKQSPTIVYIYNIYSIYISTSVFGKCSCYSNLQLLPGLTWWHHLCGSAQGHHAKPATKTMILLHLNWSFGTLGNLYCESIVRNLQSTWKSHETLAIQTLEPAFAIGASFLSCLFVWCFMVFGWLVGWLLACLVDWLLGYWATRSLGSWLLDC